MICVDCLRVLRGWWEPSWRPLALRGLLLIWPMIPSVLRVRADTCVYAYHAADGVECLAQIEDTVHWYLPGRGFQSVERGSVCGRD